MYAQLVRILILLSCLGLQAPVAAEARIVTPDYAEPKVVFDFYLDHPGKMANALYWVRSYMNPLMEAPYDMAPEFMNVVLVIHGTEIVTLAKHNYEKYHEVVERLRYYSQLGVKIRVCALAAEDYGYTAKDLPDFVEMAPSAMTELVHWQQQGYGLLRPIVMERHHSIEEIR